MKSLKRVWAAAQIGLGDSPVCRRKRSFRAGRKAAYDLKRIQTAKAAENSGRVPTNRLYGPTRKAKR
nr:MAG TPA: hypothetical protein [Caudoviricetes sp.]